MLKGKDSPKDNPGAAAPDAATEKPEFKVNAEVNAKIDAWIQKNPKQWDYIRTMPVDRMARSLALNEVRKQERTERIRTAVKQKLDANPDLKRAYQVLVKNLPEDQREKNIVRMAARDLRRLAPAPPAQKV